MNIEKASSAQQKPSPKKRTMVESNRSFSSIVGPNVAAV